MTNGTSPSKRCRQPGAQAVLKRELKDDRINPGDVEQGQRASLAPDRAYDLEAFVPQGVGTRHCDDRYVFHDEDSCGVCLHVRIISVRLWPFSRRRLVAESPLAVERTLVCARTVSASVQRNRTGCCGSVLR